jgi:hypothetical protein
MTNLKVNRPLRLIVLPLMLAALVGIAVTSADAAQPPVGRTYYTVAVGLETNYDIKAECFEFHQDKLCTLDGLICGSWEPTAAAGREMGLSFDLTTLAEGDLMSLEGYARLEAEGRKSSLAGSGQISSTDGERSASNFSFAAREVSKEQCLELLEGSPGGDHGVHVVGSGNVITEDREIEDFDGLVASGVGLIEVRVGSPASLRITADDNILPLLVSEVRDGRLILSSEGTYSTNNSVEYEITVPSLDEVTLAGVLGVEVVDLDTDRIDVNVSGVSTLTVAGRADHQQVVITGVSSYDARDLVSRTVHIDVTGICSAVVRASSSLSGSVSGGSVLDYIGNPTINVSVDPLSRLRKIG